MKKRLLSVFLAALFILSAFPVTAFSATYADELKAKGFTDAYIPYLTELHNKYPNWTFEALKTGESFSSAVSLERKTHSNQLIEKNTINDGKGYYCTCSSCYKNGTYVIQEAPNWVSASETALKYYMDPRNFLNEQSIWQFETLENKSEQTAAGVEKILNGTWMYNSVISYKDQNGKTIKMTTKYSDAIISGASGTVNGYKGIYNYYNIGAGSSATDGLYWASLDITDNCTNTDSVKLRQGASTSTAIVATLARGTAVDILSSTDVQADGYVWHNVSVPSIKKSGYIRSDLLGDSYGRPWTNPSLSIINGAKYIADDFSDEQNTVYLQKFNVNPKSSATHSHEYMKNVAAPSAEANKIYKALSGADALSRKTTFIIPVFSNMPDLKLATPAAKITANSNGGFILSWNKIINADKYEVYYDNGTGYKVFKTVTGTSLTIGTTTYGKKYQFKVRAVKNNKSAVLLRIQRNYRRRQQKSLQIQMVGLS